MKFPLFWKRVLLLVLIFSFLFFTIFIIKRLDTIKPWWILLDYLILFSIIFISMETGKMVLKIMGGVAATILGLAVLFCWRIEQYCWFGKIGDTGIVAIVTIVYVVLTYLILHNNKESFELSRLSYVQCNFLNLPSLTLALFNKGDKLVKDIIIELRLEYPAPKTIWQKVKKHMGKKRKLIYQINNLEAGKEIPISIEKDLEERIPIKLIREEMKTKSLEGERIVNVFLTYTYKSDTNYSLPEDICKKFTLKISKDEIKMVKPLPYKRLE